MQNESIAFGITFERIPYRGWTGSLRIANDLVEAVVVPTIGRVMQFRWATDGENVLWEDTMLDGHRNNNNADRWLNFGGDKIWPSPQSGWKQITGRSWPPPKAFDALPWSAEVFGSAIVITSPVDPDFGIQTVRRITLAPSCPVMSISTIYLKVAGTPIRTGIWVITQMRDAERIYAVLPEPSIFPAGFSQQSGPAPPSLEVEGRLLSLDRAQNVKIKIGLDARSLLWIGKNDILRIDSAQATGEFPDEGCHTEIYSNPDPSPYVELETLGPLATLKPGETIEGLNTYTLSRRSLPSPLAEAKKAFDIE